MHLALALVIFGSVICKNFDYLVDNVPHNKFSTQAVSCTPIPTFAQLQCDDFTSDTIPSGSTGYDTIPTGGLSASQIVTCGTFGKILGAAQFGTLQVKRKFAEQPAGAYRFVMDVYLLDTFDSGERVQITINGVVYYEGAADVWGPPNGASNECGRSDFRDYKVTVDLAFYLAEPGDITIVWDGNLDVPGNDESWAIGKFAMFYKKFTPTCDPLAGFTNKICDDFTNGIIYPNPGYTIASDSNGGLIDNSLMTVCGNLGLVLGALKFGKFPSWLERKLPDQQKGAYRVVFDLYFLDTWDGEFITLAINDQPIWSVSKSDPPGATNQCGLNPGVGSPWNDYKAPLDIPFQLLNDGDIKIKFSTNLDSDGLNESWGISKLALYFKKSMPSCTAIASYATSVCEDFNNGLQVPHFYESTIPLLPAPAIFSYHIVNCQSFGNVLGAQVLGNDSPKILLKRTLKNQLAGKYKFTFDFAFLDSWDDETAVLKIGSTIIWSETYNEHTFNGISNQCSALSNTNNQWRDRMITVTAPTLASPYNNVEYTHASPGDIVLEWSSNLSQGGVDESFGLARLVTHFQCPGTTNVFFCQSTNACRPSCYAEAATPGDVNSATNVCPGYPVQNGDNFSCDACPYDTYYCKETTSCISDCRECGYWTETDKVNEICYEPVPSKILYLCPMVGQYVLPETSAGAAIPIEVTISADSRIRVGSTPGNFQIIVTDRGGGVCPAPAITTHSAAFTTIASVTAGSSRTMTLKIAGVNYVEGCDYKVTWDTNALNVALSVIGPAFEYKFTTNPATPDQPAVVGFISTIDLSDYSQANFINVLSSISCNAKGNIRVSVNAGSVAIHIRFVNLMPGTAGLVAAYIAQVLDSWEFNVKMQEHHLGTILEGSISVGVNAQVLQSGAGTCTITTADCVLNWYDIPSAVGEPSVITVAFDAFEIPANHEVRIIFPEDWTLTTVPAPKLWINKNGGTACNSGNPISGVRDSVDPTIAVFATIPVDCLMAASLDVVNFEITGGTVPPNCNGLNGWVWGIQVRHKTTKAIHKFHLSNPPTDTCHGKSIVVFGDPHFLSFSGGYYDVTGIAGTHYNIISDMQFLWNSMFVSDDYSMAAKNVRAMQTYMGVTAFLLFGKTTIVMDPHNNDVFLDGSPLEYDVRYRLANETSKHFFVKISSEGVRILRAPGFRIAMKSAWSRVKNTHVRENKISSHNIHFDHAVDLISEEITHPHGLLGQTALFKKPVTPVDHRGTNVIEGSLREYSLYQLLQTNFRYNRFGLSKEALKQKHSHWAYPWFNRMAVANGTLKADGFEVVKTNEKNTGAFWVTHVDSYLFLPLDNSNMKKTNVHFLEHPHFDIKLVLASKSVREVYISNSKGVEILRLNSEFPQVKLRNETTFGRKMLVEYMDDEHGTEAKLGIWVEEYPLSSTGIVLTFDKIITLYLRADNPSSPYFALQVEVHDPVAVSLEASGIFIDALKNPVVHMTKSHIAQ